MTDSNPDNITTFPLSECMQHNDECNGKVEFRMALSGTGESFKRCDFHWSKRLDREQEHRKNYPDSDIPPVWFDPTIAGESWNEDY